MVLPSSHRDLVVNARRDLSKLNFLAQRRLTELRTRLQEAAVKSKDERDVALTSVTIEAADCWNSFLRAYYLSVARTAWTSSGAKIRFTTAFPNSDAAIRFALNSYRIRVPAGALLRRNDPPWHDTRQYLRLLQNAGAPNLPAIAAAFGHQTLFFRYLPTVRNFYAHRCEETFNKAARLGIEIGISTRLNMHPNETLSYIATGKPCGVMTDWLYDMEWVMDGLCA